MIVASICTRGVYTTRCECNDDDGGGGDRWGRALTAGQYVSFRGSCLSGGLACWPAGLLTSQPGEERAVAGEGWLADGHHGYTTVSVTATTAVPGSPTPHTLFVFAG